MRQSHVKTVAEVEEEEVIAGAAAGLAVTVVEAAGAAAVTAGAAVGATKAEVEVTKAEETATNRTHAARFLTTKPVLRYPCIDVCFATSRTRGVIVLSMSAL
jgi:hypothetical protein